MPPCSFLAEVPLPFSCSPTPSPFSSSAAGFSPLKTRFLYGTVRLAPYGLSTVDVIIELPAVLLLVTGDINDLVAPPIPAPLAIPLVVVCGGVPELTPCELLRLGETGRAILDIGTSDGADLAVLLNCERL